LMEAAICVSSSMASPTIPGMSKGHHQHAPPRHFQRRYAYLSTMKCPTWMTWCMQRCCIATDDGHSMPLVSRKLVLLIADFWFLDASDKISDFSLFIHYSVYSDICLFRFEVSRCVILTRSSRSL
jgi:hypothetical protein